MSAPTVHAGYSLKPSLAVDGQTFTGVLAGRRDVQLVAVNPAAWPGTPRGSLWAFANLRPWAYKAGWWWIMTMEYGTGIMNVQPVPWPVEHVASGLAWMHVPAAEFGLQPCVPTDWNPWDPPSGVVAAERESKRLVYFIQPVNGGLIKIGVARNPEGRLRLLQTGCPIDLRILAVMPGGQPVEAGLHLRFAEHRVRGEWFEPVPELLALVAGAQA